MSQDKKGSLKSLFSMGKNLNPNIPLEEQNNVRLIEYISLMLSRVGGMLGTTLMGTLATTFVYELYFGPAGVSNDRIAEILAVQTTLTTVTGLALGLIAGIVVQKWKTKLGRYRQWCFITLVPYFLVTVMFFWVPKGWSVEQLTLLRYGVCLSQTIVNAFNGFGQNIPQVISPNFKEKKRVATAWQLFYYLGYGAAYLATFVYGKMTSNNLEGMYITWAIVAAVATLIGNVMVGIFCKERIELPKKEKVALSKNLLTLFKYRNYRAYQYIQWVKIFEMLGKMSTLLVAITVGSANNILLTIPSAVGTVVGNVLCAKLGKKHEPTKLLKFCGLYSFLAATALFGACLIQSMLGIYFFQGWNSAFFYVLYFVFGIGIGIQELSTSHFAVEYNDWLEWKTGDRMEAVQGIIPGWINTALNYAKDMLIPFMLVWIGYKSSDVGNLVETMQAEPTYLKTCMWLVAFLVFGYTLSAIARALILKFLYDVEGDKKKQMYADLEQMRKARHTDNLSEAQQTAE